MKKFLFTINSNVVFLIYAQEKDLGEKSHCLQSITFFYGFRCSTVSCKEENSDLNQFTYLSRILIHNYISTDVDSIL